MRLSPADIEAIAEAVARRLHSGGPSTTGIGAPGHGEDQCEKEQNEYMDPTDTGTGGASSSPEQIAARLLSRSRLRPRPSVSRMPHARRPKGAR